MALIIVLVSVIIAAVAYICFRRVDYSRQFQHIPGPRETWLLGNALQIKPEEFHQQLKEWSKQFGPIYKLKLPGTYMIVISGFDEIWEGLHNTGLDLAGRYLPFRLYHHIKDTGLLNQLPDDRWKLLRQITQKQLKQYGEGMKRLEGVVAEMSEDMFRDFREASVQKCPLDPLDIVKSTALKIVTYVVCGERFTDNHPIIKSVLRYDDWAWKVLGDRSPDALLLDVFPPALFLPLRSSRRLKYADELRDNVARELKEFGLNREGSLIRMLHQHMGDKEETLEEKDVIITPIALLVAGLGTSSLTFYCLVNILAHRKDVQDRIWKEIRSVSPDPVENITLDNRHKMPYSRAVLFELLRYHSVAPFNTPRQVVRDTTVKGVRISEGASAVFNIWALHHDPEFWEEPETFQPERFLDGSGNVLPPDHPRRKHLLPFTSGIRGCPGEQFAMTRLWLWLTNLVKQFEITPAQGNDVSKIALSNFKLSFLLYPPRYEVMLNRRSDEGQN